MELPHHNKIDAPAANRLLHCLYIGITRATPNFLAEIGFHGDPKTIHPAFFGCYDWHSAVHSHWSSVKLLKLFPESLEAKNIKDILVEHLTLDNMKQEEKSFEVYLCQCEIPYGFSWFCHLVAEVKTWKDEIAPKILPALEYLESKIKPIMIDWLTKLKAPDRRGIHDSTAFGLYLLIDYARVIKDESFIKLITAKAKEFFMEDKSFVDPPVGFCFLSPSLVVLDLMRAVLLDDEFQKYLDSKDISPIYSMGPQTGDPEKGFDSHKIGLNFSRCFCMFNISKFVKDPEKREALQKLARAHFDFSFPLLDCGHWMADHWTTSFALKAFIAMEEKK